MSGLRQKRLLVAYNPEWRRQTNFATAMSLALLTAAMPLNNTTWPGTTLTFEDVRGCTGAHLVKRILMSRVMRWALSFNVSAKMLAGAAALLYGAAGEPTGSAVNEVQTITIDATGGTFTVAFTFEGLMDTTPAIAYNATAAQLQAALQALRSIKEGNVTVTKAGDVFTVTFVADLAATNVPQLVTAPGALTGGAGTATVATSAAGAQMTHAISRMTEDQGPSISVVVGFEGHPETYMLYEGIVANDLKVIAERRKIVTAELGVRGSARITPVPDFEMPACEDQDPLFASQCRAEVGGVFVSDIVRMEYASSNDIQDGDDAFPFDDKDVERLEVGDQWQPEYTLETYGTSASPLYQDGISYAEKSAALHFGPPGERVSFIAPKAHLQLVNGELGFSGQARRSTVPLTITPLEVSGAAPDSVTVKLDADQLLDAE